MFTNIAGRNFFLTLGLYADNGKENGNYCIIMGHIYIYIPRRSDCWKPHVSFAGDT